MKAKTRWLDRRVAAPGPCLALCLNQEEFDAACSHIRVQPFPFIMNEWSDATVHFFESWRGQCAIVCLRNYYDRNPIEVAGILVHEAVHIWQEYTLHIGEKFPGREQEAYAIQSISQELMAEFSRRMS